MSENTVGEAAKAVVRRNTEEVQGGGDYALFDELFADAFVDHTPQPGRTPDKAGALHFAGEFRPDLDVESPWLRGRVGLADTVSVQHGQ